MDIIKDAFDEGRDTDIPWLESEAKKNKIKLNVAIENYSMLANRSIGSIIRIAKLDPDTGKILQIFHSRLQAAQHIVKEILKTPKKNPISVTGNMALCIAAGWKSYGYYWKYLTEKEYIKLKHKDDGTIILVSGGKTSTEVYSSIREAGRALSMSESNIRKGLKTKKRINNRYFRYVNNQPKTLTFSSYTAAGTELGLSPNKARKLAQSGKPYNNYTIIINNNIAAKYQLYKNGVKYGTPVVSLRNASKLINYHIKTDHLATGRSFGPFKQWSIRPNVK